MEQTRQPFAPGVAVAVVVAGACAEAAAAAVAAVAAAAAAVVRGGVAKEGVLSSTTGLARERPGVMVIVAILPVVAVVVVVVVAAADGLRASDEVEVRDAFAWSFFTWKHSAQMFSRNFWGTKLMKRWRGGRGGEKGRGGGEEVLAESLKVLPFLSPLKCLRLATAVG